MIEHAVFHFLGQIESSAVIFKAFHNAHTLFVMLEVAAYVAERLLSHMSERGVSQVVAHGDGFHKVFIQPQGAGHRTADLRHFKGMRHACPVMVAFRRDIHLCLMFQPAERIAVENTVPVALKFCAHGIFRFLPASFCVRGKSRFRTQKFLFQLFCTFTDQHGRSFLNSAFLCFYCITCFEKDFQEIRGPPSGKHRRLPPFP